MADGILLIDVEASGLHEGSYPTEVAWCSRDLLAGASYLIRPPQHWLDSPWSSEAEAITGISQVMLGCYGLPPKVVAERLNADLDGELPFTDAPLMDGRWLNMLHTEAGVTPTWIIPADNRPCDLDRVVLGILSEAGQGEMAVAAAHERRVRLMAEAAGLREHRALDDAIRHAFDLGAAVLLDQHRDDVVTIEAGAAELVRRAVALRARAGRIGEARRA